MRWPFHRRADGGRRRRLRAALATAGVAIAVLLVAVAGGFLSGRLQHSATYHGTGSLPPVVTVTTTTFAAPTPTASSAEPLVRAQLVQDMTLDVESQRLSPDPAKRAALAATPAAIAARHNAIVVAWAPDRAPQVAAMYDRRVLDNARDPTSPSVTQGQFVVTTWSAISIAGNTASATLLGHYHLVEPTNTANGGAIDLPDQVWTITMRLSGGRWRLENRDAI